MVAIHGAGWGMGQGARDAAAAVAGVLAQAGGADDPMVVETNKDDSRIFLDTREATGVVRPGAADSGDGVLAAFHLTHM
jgi:hypothetical protein